MLNNICLVGRLTQDPDLKTTQSGKTVTAFTLAVDRDFKSKDGERSCDFIPCVAWRNTAEFICRYFRKGSQAAVSGALQSRKYQDKDGTSRTAYEVVVNSIYFSGRKADADTVPTSAARPYEAPAAVTPVPAREALPGGEDFAIVPDYGDLPF